MWTDRLSWPIRCLHEWPLVLFTAFAIPGAGLFVARLLGEFIGLLPATPDPVLRVGTLLVGCGLLLSFAHLGRPLRAPLALRRTARNTLSTEVAFAGGVLLFGLLLSAPGTPASTQQAAADTAGVLSIGLLAMMGFVYFVPGCWPWRSLLVVGPLCAGVTSGTIFLVVGDRHPWHPSAAAALGTPPSLWLFGLALIALDAGLFAFSWRGLATAPGLPAHPKVFEHRRAVQTLRVVLVTLVPAGLLLAAVPLGAAIAIGLGLLVDRFAFYGLVRVRTTEAEIAAAERDIALVGPAVTRR